MSSGIFSSERNLSLYTVPAAWFLAIIPHVLAITGYSGFDNRNPRSMAKDMAQDQAIDRATRDKVFRLSSASSNGLENIGLFAAAVVAGNMAGLSNETLNRLSLSYLASRVVYNILYVNSKTQPVAYTRSAVFWIGQGLIGSLFVRSGSAINTLKIHRG